MVKVRVRVRVRARVSKTVWRSIRVARGTHSTCTPQECNNWYSCTYPSARFTTSFFVCRILGEERHHILNADYVVRRSLRLQPCTHAPRRPAHAGTQVRRGGRRSKHAPYHAAWHAPQQRSPTTLPNAERDGLEPPAQPSAAPTSARALALTRYAVVMASRARSSRAWSRTRRSSSRRSLSPCARPACSRMDRMRSGCSQEARARSSPCGLPSAPAALRPSSPRAGAGLPLGHPSGGLP